MRCSLSLGTQEAPVSAGDIREGLGLIVPDDQMQSLKSKLSTELKAAAKGWPHRRHRQVARHEVPDRRVVPPTVDNTNGSISHGRGTNHEDVQ
jgi:hypothetical protein